MSSHSSSPNWSAWYVWRSAAAAYAIVALALLIAVPLFLRMPPWCDLTLYDLAANAVLAGDVHYRDVFDTNLPGFVWLLSLVRLALGPSMEAVRAVDLVVVAVIVWQLTRLARAAGASTSHVAWLVTGAAVFYPCTTEFNHAQRDIWMMLPALAAVAIRSRRLRLAAIVRARRRHLRYPHFVWSVLEGSLWGLGVWIKPHLILVAAGVWLATAPFLTRPRQIWRPIVCDALGNLVGGVLVGLLGITWLLETGTWPYFIDIVTNWLPHYTNYTQNELPRRFGDQPWYFTPWSLMQPIALMLTLADFVAAWCPRAMRWLPWWLAQPATSERGRLARLLLAAVYWAWILQALLIQRRFHYVHIPETLLFFAVIAAHRWALIQLGLVIITITSLWFILHEESSDVPTVPAPGQVWFEKHPLFDRTRLDEWANCWRNLDTLEYRARQDRLAQLKGSFPSISVAECGEVADFLTARGARADEVIAWHDSPHAVYLSLPGRPRFRFMHIDTPFLSETTYDWMWQECKTQALPHAKYVVIDLVRMYVTRRHGSARDWTTLGENLLPTSTPPLASCVFPYNQRGVFRSAGGLGRYVVFAIVEPPTISEYHSGIDIWANEE